jgi:primosomal protein N' (replication factor Y)
MVSPLRLKSQKVGKPEVAAHNPVLSILVDTGVYHLDQPYDYLLPSKFQVNPGDWVSIPFRGKTSLGLVVNRQSSSTIAKLEFINRPAKAEPIAPEFIDLYRRIAERWAVPIFDVLRFVARQKLSADTLHSTFPKLSRSSGIRRYLQLQPLKNEIYQVKEYAEKIAETGKTLLIVPESRTRELLSSSKYHVAMRSGILKPERYENILILREESELHYEIKSPGFNTRDVALLRNDLFMENLFFIGFSPSLEMANLIAKGYVQLKRNSGKVKVAATPSLQGELIPSGLVSKVKDALKRGSVLVLAPSKGYGIAVSCLKCKNIANCVCGGRLTKKSKADDPSCVICQKIYPAWRCSDCGNQQIRIIGKGIERIAEEFGKSFPNSDIHISTAEKRIEGVIAKRSIILSTIGAAPIQGYSSVLFLDGINMSADLRSEERALSNFFRYSSLSTGEVLIVERPESPLVSALMRWNPFNILDRNLSELKELNLPPHFRHFLLKGEKSEIPRIFTGLQNASKQGRISSSLRLYNIDDSYISGFFSLKDAQQVLQFIREFQRKRSMSGKPPLAMRVDPYLLG